VTPELWAQIEELFHQAAERDATQRARLLDDACNNNMELRRQVERLLASEQSAREDMQALVRDGFDAVSFPLAGETVSHYKILKGLGGGGMGLVYEAEDLRLGRRVALKFLPEESAKDPAALARFEREARSASALEHPNICAIYEFGDHEGQPFLAMQLLEGQTLRDRIAHANGEKPPFEVNTLLGLAIQIVSGLNAAHQKGIVHRDIKPANIFVTNAGQAEILDFGLAKLSEFAEPEETFAPTGVLPAARGLPLSRTGKAIGTDGYMSPEQRRGEKLDARTDIFSFGLVLYEMATGKRAVTVDALTSEKATPDDASFSMWHFDERLPPELKKIVRRAVGSQREARYQCAAELRKDLEQFQRKLQSRRRLRYQTAVGVVLLSVFATGAWLVARSLQASQAPRHIRQRQLTTNSSENQVRGGAISPDGKYLAYSDLNGIHIRSLETERTITVPHPESLGKSPANANWEAGPWLPDSTGFMAELDTEEANISYWLVSLSGGPPRRIRDDDINPWSYSRDGWLVASKREKPPTLGGPEIWIMRPDGTQERLVHHAEDSVFRWITWSADGSRIAYVRERSINSRHETSIETIGLEGGSPTTLLPGTELERFGTLGQGAQSLIWLPGRIIYGQGAAEDDDCPGNLFEARVNDRTGTLLSKPHQMTDWAGFCTFGLSATADGKRLAFFRRTQEMPVFVAEFDPRRRSIGAPSRFTLTEDLSRPLGWTPDSKTIFFISNREKTWGIFRQNLGSTTPEAVVTGLSDMFEAAFDANRQSLLYTTPDPSDSTGTFSALMSVPFVGGVPELVRKGRLNGVGCSLSANHLCAIGEWAPDKREIIFYALDPTGGQGRELNRLEDDRPTGLDWALSPDGRWIAVAQPSEQRFLLLPVDHQDRLEIPIKGGARPHHFAWAGDSSGLFVSFKVQQGEELAHIALNGNVHKLWEDRGFFVGIHPSAAPDGRHLAIGASRQNVNVWMIEGF